MQAALEREAVRNVLRVKRVNGGKGEELECSQGVEPGRRERGGAGAPTLQLGTAGMPDAA